MSLKDFHVIFVTASVACAIGFGCWAFGQYTATSAAGYLATAVVSFLAAIALIVYEIQFVKKMKDE